MKGIDRDARISSARMGDGAGMPLPAVMLFRKDLKERVDLHSLEDPVDSVWVFSGERLRFCKRLGLDDDEAASLVGERTCQNHPPLSVQRFHSSEVGGPVNLAPDFPLWPVEAEDDEFHGRFTLWVEPTSERVGERLQQGPMA